MAQVPAFYGRIRMTCDPYHHQGASTVKICASFVTIVASAFFTATPVVLAAGDMLQPDEVQTTGISSNPANDSGLFLQGALGFGQVRSTEDQATPGLGLLVSAEPGYQFNTGSWSRVEVSAQVMAGQLAFRTAEDNAGKVTLPIGLGVLAKIGWGYSLGNKLTGMIRLGAGPLLGKFEAHPAFGSVTSDGTIMGLGLMAGYDLIVPMNSFLDGVLGFNWLHAEFDVKDAKVNGASSSVSRSVVVNMPQALLGLRIRL